MPPVPTPTTAPTIHRFFTPNGSVNGVTPSLDDIAGSPWPAGTKQGAVVYQPSELLGGSIPDLTQMIDHDAQFRLRSGLKAWIAAAQIGSADPDGLVMVDLVDMISPRFPTAAYARSEWAGIYPYHLLFADVGNAIIDAARAKADGRRIAHWCIPDLADDEVTGPATYKMLEITFGPLIGPEDVIMPVAYVARATDADSLPRWKDAVRKRIIAAITLIDGDRPRVVPVARARHAGQGQTGYMTGSEWAAFLEVCGEFELAEVAVWEACATHEELGRLLAWASAAVAHALSGT